MLLSRFATIGMRSVVRCVRFPMQLIPLNIVNCVRYLHSTPIVSAPKLKGGGKVQKAAKLAAEADDDEVEVVLPDTNELDQHMEKMLTYLNGELAKIQGGRASADMLNFIDVEAYGDFTPISEMAQISLKSPTKLLVSVFDNEATALVATALRECGLGLTPVVEGSNITVNVPKQSKEARAAIVKVAAKQAESIKNDIRNARKNFLSKIKGLKGKISDDDIRRLNKEVDTVTEKKTDKVSKLLKDKETSIMES